MNDSGAVLSIHINNGNFDTKLVTEPSTPKASLDRYTTDASKNRSILQFYEL